jgi:transposase
MAEQESKGVKVEPEEEDGLPVLRHDVAGVDLGSKEHWVCAPSADGKGREVARFGATTIDLEEMAKWLKERKVKSVAMEGTGVYWIAPHEVLEARGLEVLLVNTRELARVPGRKKTDRVDCKWIQRLHSCGLLAGSFRPEEEVCMLRTLVRDHANLVAEAGDWLRRMQKSLDQMNVRVHRAVSDLDGTTGMAIIEAIVKGERDPVKLAQLRHPNCHKTPEEFVKQMSGHWRNDHLFSLKQSLGMYQAVEQRIGAYDREIMRSVKEMEREDCRGKKAPELKNRNKAQAIVRRGEEPLRQAMYRMTGVDLTTIDAIGVRAMEVVISEYGPDLSRFPTEKQFVSHVTLAPRRPITGGKPVKKKRKRNSASTRVAEVLRMAAQSMEHSKSALGAFFRRMAYRRDRGVATFSTARKLAQNIYRLLKWKQPYEDEGAAAYEKRYREARIHHLTQIASELGLELRPKTEPQTAEA